MKNIVNNNGLYKGLFNIQYTCLLVYHNPGQSATRDRCGSFNFSRSTALAKCRAALYTDGIIKEKRLHGHGSSEHPLSQCRGAGAGRGRLAAPPRRCRSTRPHQPRCAGKLLCHRH